MDKNALEQILEICDKEEDVVTFVRELFSRLGEKWPMRVLDQLAEGPQRFTVLLGALTPISHRVLTVTLRTLESDGMVSRTSFPETPPRVEYSLTPLGASFLAHALSLVRWSQDHRHEIEVTRKLSRRGTSS